MSVIVDKPEKKTNPWLEHVRRHRSRDPTLSYKEALVAAKATYTPREKEIKEKVPPGERKPNKWMEHIDSFKRENPDWKNTYSYKQVLQMLKDTYKQSAPQTTQETE